MIAHTQKTAAGAVNALFVGKDALFAAGDFSAQYDKLLAEFPAMAGLIYAEQVHGNRVYEVGDEPGRIVCVGEGDALFTRRKNRGVLIRTADCIPILFYSQEEPLVGAIHAGWRGLRTNILSKTLAATAGLAGLRFVVGPFIGGESYEVGEDVAHQFAPAFSTSKGNGKYLLKLRQILEAEFAVLGVGAQAVTWYDENTLGSGGWYSARGGDARRNLSVIFLES